jgi:hypothetical protein
VNAEVIPTLHQREHYCESAAHAACPTFVTFGRRGPMSEESYFAQWMPPVPRRAAG